MVVSADNVLFPLLCCAVLDEMALSCCPVEYLLIPHSDSCVMPDAIFACLNAGVTIKHLNLLSHS